MSFLKKHIEHSAYVPYFAYHLCLDPEQMGRTGIFCREPVLCRLPGHRLVFNVLEDRYFRFEKRGLANIVPSPGDSVEGMLYQIHVESLEQLDQHAGVEEYRYYRKLVEVKTQEGKQAKALAYAAWPDVTSEGLLPSRMYLNQLLSVALRYNFSDDFRHWLEQHPTVK